MKEKYSIKGKGKHYIPSNMFGRYTKCLMRRVTHRVGLERTELEADNVSSSNAEVG